MAPRKVKPCTCGGFFEASGAFVHSESCDRTEFKVMDEKTGLFSTGGYAPSFNEKGKTWRTIGQVRSHLKLYARGHARFGDRPKKIPASWVVVEFELRQVGRRPASDVVG